MAGTTAAQIAALTALVGTGVVYGTDVFCAMVLRPALARVDDGALAAVTGFVHRYGDRRMPVPGVVGILGAVASAVFAAVSAAWTATVLAGVAAACLVGWLLVYVRVSAPINRELTAAAQDGRVPPDVRELQARWDRVIAVRALLQGLAVAALGLALIA